MSREDLEAMLEALKAAKYSGVLRVKHGETETLFRSMSDLDKAIKDLEDELAALDGKARSRVVYVRQRD